MAVTCSPLLLSDGRLPSLSDVTLSVLPSVRPYVLGRCSCVEAGSNTSTVALRLVGGDGKGTSTWGITGQPCSWGIYKYGDLALQVGGVSNLRQ
jgi:hypothetical protein